MPARCTAGFPLCICAQAGFAPSASRRRPLLRKECVVVDGT